MMKIIFLCLIIIFAVISAFAQESSVTREKLDCPMDASEINFMPSSLSGLKQSPAKIISVADLQWNNKWQSTVWLKNLSSKTIVAVKIKWFLYRVDRKDNIITPRANPNIVLQGETPIIKIDELKPDEESKYIEYPIASCREIYDALVKDGDAEGEPWIEPAVIEISYTDGSKWTRLDQ